MAAAEFVVNENNLHGWLKRCRDKPNMSFPGSGKLRDLKLYCYLLKQPIESRRYPSCWALTLWYG